MATLTISREEREELRDHLERVLDPHWDGGPTDEASGRAWMGRIRLMDQLGWDKEPDRDEFEISGFDLEDELRPMIHEFADYTDEVRRNCAERVESARQSLAIMDGIKQRMHGLIREQHKAVAA